MKVSQTLNCRETMSQGNRRTSQLTCQIELTATFTRGVFALPRFSGFVRLFVCLFCWPEFPHSAAVGVTVVGLMVLAVRFADARRFVGLLIRRVGAALCGS